MVDFFLFALVATWSAYYNGIWDCDESMNYFEPFHQLLFGYGLQTWEYRCVLRFPSLCFCCLCSNPLFCVCTSPYLSPMYALRSYFYLLVHTVGAYIPVALDALQLFPLTKIGVFYGIRLFLGLVCAVCNTHLLRTVQLKYGNDTGQLLQLFLVVTPGMFISSTAFLPSTFAMLCYSAMLACWMRGQLVAALYLVSLAACVGWPFSLLVGLPLALHILFKRGILFAIGHGLLSLVLFLGPSVAVDTHFYHKLVIAPLQIVLYNVFGHAGPELYGVEPWYYYLLNGFLNFNFVLPLALVAPLILLLWGWKSARWSATRETLLYLSGGFLWLAYMSYIPHKEERFLFVIYPWICVAAALTLSTITKLFANWEKLVGTSVAFLLLFIVALSVARNGAMYINYEAPISVYTHLYSIEDKGERVSLFSHPLQSIHSQFAFSNMEMDDAALEEDAKQFTYVCVGREWYRFSTHFFLPPHLRLGFLRDEFHGQLPQYYSSGPDATWRIPEHFNDLNREEETRYIDPDRCTYWVHFFEDGQSYHQFKDTNTTWEVAYHAPFLSASLSKNAIARAFYIPTYSEENNVYGHYTLLRRRQPQSQ